MSKPFMIIQVDLREFDSSKEREAWIRANADAAREQGAQHARVTLGDGIDMDWLLFEAWHEKNPEEGSPRFRRN